MSNGVPAERLFSSAGFFDILLLADRACGYLTLGDVITKKRNRMLDSAATAIVLVKTGWASLRLKSGSCRRNSEHKKMMVASMICTSSQ